MKSQQNMPMTAMERKNKLMKEASEEIPRSELFDATAELRKLAVELVRNGARGEEEPGCTRGRIGSKGCSRRSKL